MGEALENRKNPDRSPSRGINEFKSQAFWHIYERDHEKYENKQHTVFDRMVSKHIESCVTDIVKTSRLKQKKRKEEKKKMQIGVNEEPSERAKKLAAKRQEMEYARMKKQEEIKRKLAESMLRIEEIEKQKTALLHENMIAM